MEVQNTDAASAYAGNLSTHRDMAQGAQARVGRVVLSTHPAIHPAAAKTSS